ncbi:hypothetical protein D9756_008201 [Leucocoprinus leucothites]|uniref:Uncharacterized protein n=1 Tax=Leucocoprinus leucothites TaxID=201217 RepID=A0A8H5D012_9AGAR|nr:hypothetical protein D9756_008201 [Leucoagaricus leucothites]
MQEIMPRDIDILPAFDRLRLIVNQSELRLNVDEIAIEATPIDGKIENVLKWRLICISYPENFPGKIRTVTFEVNHHPLLGDKVPTCVSLRSGSCVDLVEGGMRTDKFWWRTRTRVRPGGLSFNDIIKFLEEDQNRYEKYVDQETLEGTDLWVLEQLRALDMNDYVDPLPGGLMGEHRSALTDFEETVEYWKPVYELTLEEAKLAQHSE